MQVANQSQGGKVLESSEALGPQQPSRQPPLGSDVDLRLRAAQTRWLEGEQASNLWGQLSRLGGWDKALSCPEA